jgi:hypothetical protein
MQYPTTILKIRKNADYNRVDFRDCGFPGRIKVLSDAFEFICGVLDGGICLGPSLWGCWFHRLQR